MPRKHKIQLHLQDIMGDGCHPFVNALVNGTEARLLIDTGASKTVLDKTFLLSLEPKVNLEQSEQLSTGLGAGNLPSEYAQNLKLEIGDWNVDEASVAVLDLYHVNETYKSIGLPILHGVIGGDLLFSHQAVINYKKAELKLTSPKRKKHNGKKKTANEISHQAVVKTEPVIDVNIPETEQTE
jgi:hypothetical protein